MERSRWRSKGGRKKRYGGRTGFLGAAYSQRIHHAVIPERVREIKKDGERKGGGRGRGEMVVVKKGSVGER